ncbi:MAG TPA: class I SAM-dependent rRNA methyltransferase [Pirellulaceae bacterium]|nr:class I SAM-dependent rRNA methyltransferase [Pirellulaceae bacterium]
MTPRPLTLPSDQPLPRVVAKSVGLHPFLYRKRIERIDREARPGDLVAVYAEDRLAGYGLVNPKAEISVRMLSWGDERPDEAWWQARLEAAVRLRREVLKLDDVTDSYRMIHAEADGLPGLVIDKLGEVLSAECFSVGMYERAEALVKLLAPLVETKQSLIRCGPATLSQEGFEGPSISSEGLPPRITIQEFGTRFRVDFAGSHKTGFFCDQRDNRRMLAGFCGGKSVLDLCCYSGGFAIQAKKLGGAAEVTGVDLDEEPLALARENANLNQVRVKFVQADAFAYMRDMLANGRKYDVVVLDPPKLIRNRAELEEGTHKHFDLNRIAMQLVAPGGLMVTCTCAGLLSPEEFLRLIYAGARQAGEDIPGSSPRRRAVRTCQILYKTGAAPDHPVVTHCPETEYLQAVWLRLL